MTPAAPELPRWRRGLGAAVTGLTMATGVLALWAASSPFGDFGWAMIALLAGTLAAVAVTALIVACAISRCFSPALVVPVVAFALVALAVRFDLPLAARFALAKPGFEQAILDRGEAGPTAPCPARIGSYRVYGCYTSGSNTYFHTPGGFLDTVGVAYLPEGVPAERGRRVFAELDGPWFAYVEDW